MIKVLIVDDSAIVRQAYKTLLDSDQEIQVIGTASDPYIAVQKIQKEKPDVITLDIEMPRMDGLTFLKKIMQQAPMPVVVISNQTSKGADVALKALEYGAVEVMAKPSLQTEQEVLEARISLSDKIRSAFFSKVRNGRSDMLLSKDPVAKVSRPNSSDRTESRRSYSLIAIGASTGGVEALTTFLRTLPADIPPIVIVQHMPANFTSSFAKRLNNDCIVEVKEAEDKEVLRSGTVYIAPGGRHMKIAQHGGIAVVSIYDGELVNRHRPSVNVLFNSVAEIKARNAIGIIMTGMGDDGANGLLAMHEKGAYTIAQDESSSVIFGMPQKAILAGGVTEVVSLSEMSKVVLQKLNIMTE